MQTLIGGAVGIKQRGILALCKQLMRTIMLVSYARCGIQGYIQNQNLQPGPWNESWELGVACGLLGGLSLHAHCPNLRFKNLLKSRTAPMKALGLPGSLCHCAIGGRSPITRNHVIGIFPFITGLWDQKPVWQSTGLIVDWTMHAFHVSMALESDRNGWMPQWKRLNTQVCFQKVFGSRESRCTFGPLLLTGIYFGEPERRWEHGRLGIERTFVTPLPRVKFIQIGIFINGFQLKAGWPKWLSFKLKVSSLPDISCGRGRIGPGSKRRVRQSALLPVSFPQVLHNQALRVLSDHLLKHAACAYAIDDGVAPTREGSGHEAASNCVDTAKGPSNLGLHAREDRKGFENSWGQLRDHFFGGNYPTRSYHMALQRLKSFYWQGEIDHFIDFFRLNQWALGPRIHSQVERFEEDLKKRLKHLQQTCIEEGDAIQDWHRTSKSLQADIAQFGLKACQSFCQRHFGDLPNAENEVQLINRLSERIDRLRDHSAVTATVFRWQIYRLWSRYYLEYLVDARQLECLAQLRLASIQQQLAFRLCFERNKAEWFWIAEQQPILATYWQTILIQSSHFYAQIAQQSLRSGWAQGLNGPNYLQALMRVNADLSGRTEGSTRSGAANLDTHLDVLKPELWSVKYTHPEFI